LYRIQEECKQVTYLEPCTRLRKNVNKLILGTLYKI